MTRDEIVKAAVDAGFSDLDGPFTRFARFARAIAATERERCAKVCEEKAIGTPGQHGSGNDRRFKVANECADAIYTMTDEEST
jgi:hypothetical protein